MFKYFESKGPPGGLGALQTLYNLFLGRTGTAQHIYLFNKIPFDYGAKPYCDFGLILILLEVLCVIVMTTWQKIILININVPD